MARQRALHFKMRHYPTLTRAKGKGEPTYFLPH
jgi:hypothetical protein